MNPANAFTERLFVSAGIRAGMRVLDLGCGRGDVSLLAAQLVGPGGAVVGVDRDGAAIGDARNRARELGTPQVTFVDAALDAVELAPASFDAIVARRVLMYLPAPGDTLRRLVSALRPGGVVAVQEHDATMVPAGRPQLPLHDRVMSWIWTTVEREGGNLHMGFELATVLEDAGLEDVRAGAEAVVRTAHDPDALAPIVRAMLPRMVEHRVASAAEIDLDTLGQRLVDERRTARATYVTDMAFGVWARKPGPSTSPW
jgi:ubiquinone/menaquinone biosynthesis C-methylase UbiE